MSAAHTQAHFSLDFFTKANTMNPDQNAPLGPYLFLKYRLPKNILNHTIRERSGSVVAYLTRDLGAAISSLTGVTVLCP